MFETTNQILTGGFEYVLNHVKSWFKYRCGFEQREQNATRLGIEQHNWGLNRQNTHRVMGKREETCFQCFQRDEKTWSQTLCMQCQGSVEPLIWIEYKRALKT